MKSVFLILFSLFMCGFAFAAEDSGWVQYAQDSFINTTPKNISVNPVMKQISYYSKQTKLTKTVQGQPVDTVVTLGIVDCSGIAKTKDISTLYYNADKLISKIELDKTTSWEYYSPDSPYYQNLQVLCSANFKN